MGEARRRAAQGLPPRQPKASTKAVDTSPRVVSWLPLTRNQTQQFMAVTTRGAWIGIGGWWCFGWRCASSAQRPVGGRLRIPP